MAHSEMYEDGSELHQFFKADQATMAKKFGELSSDAFSRGAVAIKQKLMNDNEPCVCGSGLRFDLCCKSKAVELEKNL